MLPDLSISIVTWNTREFLDKFLASIYAKTSGITFEVLVSDNNSSDGTSEMIKSKYPRVILTKNDSDLYFVKATNQNLRKAAGRYAAILTPDTLAMENSFGKLVRFMNKNPACGAAGPMLLNPDMSLQKNGVRFPTFTYGLFEALMINTIFPRNRSRANHEFAEWDGKTPREVEYVSGACLVVRKEALEKAGLLDENITMYWEDADLCRRIKSAGYTVCFVPEAKIIHYWGESSKKEGLTATEKIFNRSMVYYYGKYYGAPSALLLKFIIMFFKTPLLSVRRAFK